MKKVIGTLCLVLIGVGCFSQCTNLSYQGGGCVLTTSYMFGTNVTTSGSWINAYASFDEIQITVSANTAPTHRSGTVYYTEETSEGTYTAGMTDVSQGQAPSGTPGTPVCDNFAITGPSQLEWASGSIEYAFGATPFSTGTVSYNWSYTGGPLTDFSPYFNVVSFYADIAVAVNPIVVSVSTSNGCSASHYVQVFP